MVELLAVNEADHDNDGIPSYLEDYNGNGYLYDDNTDSDREEELSATRADFIDSDDDGDGISTRDELGENGEFLFTNGGEVPDHRNTAVPGEG